LNKELKQYIKRRRQGQNVRVGVMYAQVLMTGEVTLGFSLCSKEDQFCPEVADHMAFCRSLAYMDRSPYIKEIVDGQHVITKNLIPDSCKTDMAVFIGRVERFFKEHTLPKWAADYYADHKDLVEAFFAALEKKKAAAKAKEAPVNGGA